MVRPDYGLRARDWTQETISIQTQNWRTIICVLHVAMLRTKVVEGVVASTIQPGIELLMSLQSAKPHVVPEMNALKTLECQLS